MVGGNAMNIIPEAEMKSFLIAYHNEGKMEHVCVVKDPRPYKPELEFENWNPKAPELTALQSSRMIYYINVLGKDSQLKEVSLSLQDIDLRISRIVRPETPNLDLYHEKEEEIRNLIRFAESLDGATVVPRGSIRQNALRFVGINLQALQEERDVLLDYGFSEER